MRLPRADIDLATAQSFFDRRGLVPRKSERCLLCLAAKVSTRALLLKTSGRYITPASGVWNCRLLGPMGPSNGDQR